MRAATPKLQAGERIAQFEVERMAGRGGMGEVYRARDTETGEPVALKILRRREEEREEEQEDSLSREAWVLASIDHPGIVRFISSGEAACGLYLVMEWLEGEKLSQRLQRGPLSVAESLRLVAGAADALSTAHRRGLIHCDIKPGNLFLPAGDPAQVKILDFGLAQQRGSLRSLDSASSDQHIVGTPAYMAPEQARGQSHLLDPRADVFSLGCVLFECLAGRAAFAGKHMTAVLAKILF